MEHSPPIFIKFKVVVCKSLSVSRSLKFVVWEKVAGIGENAAVRAAISPFSTIFLPHQRRHHLGYL